MASSSMLSKLKQYKDLRSQAKSVQSVLSEETVHADGAGGKVNIVMDGNQKIMSLDIDESLLAPEHKEKIQQGVIDAIAASTKKIQKVMAKKIQSGEMEMPDISGLKQ